MGNIALVQRAVSLLEESIKQAAAPFQPKGDHLTTSHSRPPMLSPAWTVLEGEAGALRASIHHAKDSLAAQGPVLSAWHSLCDLGRVVEMDLTTLTPGIWDTGDWDGWRARVSAACGAVQREGAKRRRSAHTACINYHIERRGLHGINAEDGVPGGLRSLIRKVGRSDCSPISPKQVRTAAGGGSTAKHVILREQRRCHFEWTRSRRSLPTSGEWPPWARAMYRLDPLSCPGDALNVSTAVSSAWCSMGDTTSPCSSSEEIGDEEDDESSLYSTPSPPPSDSDSSLSCPPSSSSAGEPRGSTSLPPPLKVPAEGCFTAPVFPTLDIAYPLTWPEFLGVLKSAHDGAPGPSGITYAMLRALPKVVQEAWFSILQRCLHLQELPQSFLLGHICAMPKPGEASLQNCRPITLMECTMKLLTGALNKRLMDGLLLHEVFCYLQHGFIPGRCGTDPVYILKYALEDARERNVNVYLMLVDLEKAFDSVEPWSLALSYRWAGLSPASASMLSALDGAGWARVVTPVGLTPPHRVWRGVRQGETLSPTKFILWLEPWLRHAYALYSFHGHTLRGGARLSHQAMCDDLAFLTTTRVGMQCISTSCWRFLFFHGVTASSKKTLLATTHPHPGLVTMFSFLRSSSPGLPGKSAASLVPITGGKPFRYLGDQVVMNHRWHAATTAMSPVLQMDVAKLAKRRVSILDALQYYSSVTLGKGGYFLPLSRISTTQLTRWDSQLRRILVAKATMAPSSSAAPLFASKPAGLGVTSLSTLVVAAGITELYKRLISPGLLGEATRSRWDALQAQLLIAPALCTWKPSELANHHIGHLLRLAWRMGVEVSSLSAFRSEYSRRSAEGALEIVMDTPELSKFMDRMRRSPFRSLEEVRDYVASSPGPPPAGHASLLPAARADFAPLPFCSARCSYLNRRCRRCCAMRPPRRKRRSLRPRVQYSWCWAVAASLLAPGAPVTVPRAPLTEASSLLTSLSPPPPPAGSLPLVLYSDGSLHAEGQGGCAVICKDLADVRVQEWEDKLLKLEDGSLARVRCNGLGLVQAGLEPLEIGFLELLICVWVAEQGPSVPTTLHVDASYVIDTLATLQRGISSLRWARLNNGPLWRRLLQACARRARDGYALIMVKCSAHGRDPHQSLAISHGNSCADSGANAFVQGTLQSSPYVLGAGLLPPSVPHPLATWSASCEEAFVVSASGCVFRSDVRTGIRKLLCDRWLRHWSGLTASGDLVRAVATGELAVTSLRAIRSRRSLSRIGAVSAHNTLFCLRSLAVRGPSRMFRSDRGNWPLLPRSTGGKPLCPICEAALPDPWHTGLECPVVEEDRRTVRTVVRSLLACTLSLVSHPIPLVSLLKGWLSSSFELGPVQRIPAHSFGGHVSGALLLDCLPAGGFGPHLPEDHSAMAELLMSKLSRARPAPTFVLLGGAHASGTCVALRKLKMQFSVSLIVPEGRWPGLVLPQVADSPTWFLGGSVWLLSWGIATTLPAPSPASIAALSHLLCQRLWKGTLELLFHWGKQSWPLDAVGHPCLQDQLDEWGILPATPCSRISLFSSAGPRRSWLGFLPRERPPPLRSIAAAFPLRAKELWTLLDSVLGAGIAYVHLAYSSLVSQDLSFRKRYALARFRGAPPPARKSPFRSWAGAKAFFPPSQALLNQAVAFLASAPAPSSSRAHVASYAQTMAIPASRVPSLWLAIRFAESRMSAAALASIAPMPLITPPPLPTLCVRDLCVTCHISGRVALVRCPACSQPRYCSRACRLKDSLHREVCNSHLPEEAEADVVLLCTRPPEGSWSLCPARLVRNSIPPRLPRLHPHLGLVYIAITDPLFDATAPPEGGFTPLSLNQVGSGLLGLPPAPVPSGEPTAQTSSPPPTGGDDPSDNVHIIPPHLTISLPVDAIEDHGPSTPTMEDLRPPTSVSWTEWLRPPPFAVRRVAQTLAGGLACPIDVTSLLGEAWVGDFVICATVFLLAPCCRSGVHLFPPMLPGEPLDGADRRGLWATTLSSSSSILLPILCSGHWFLLRLLPQLRRGVVYNSIPGHGDGSLISSFTGDMLGITGMSWEVVSGAFFKEDSLFQATYLWL